MNKIFWSHKTNIQPWKTNCMYQITTNPFIRRPLPHPTPIHPYTIMKNQSLNIGKTWKYHTIRIIFYTILFGLVEVWLGRKTCGKGLVILFSFVFSDGIIQHTSKHFPKIHEMNYRILHTHTLTVGRNTIHIHICTINIGNVLLLW